MVAAMIGDEHFLQVVALGDADGDAQHDAIAEGHYGALHVVCGIMTLGDGISTLQERTLEVLVHEPQVDGDMLDAQTLTMHLGKGYLALVVIATIIETNAQGYLVLLVIEQGDAVHTSAHDNH